MRDIGDVYASLPVPVVELSDRERIIEVLGIGRVDGECHHLAVILALGNLIFCYARVDLLGSLHKVLWVFVWQAVFGEDGMHLGIVLTILSEYVDDLADRVLRELRPAFDQHIDLVAVLCLAESFGRDVDVLVERAVVGNDEVVATRLLQHAHIAMLHALNDLKNTRTHAVALCLTTTYLFDFHLVARQCLHVITIIYGECIFIAFDPHLVHSIVTTVEDTFQFHLSLAFGISEGVTSCRDLLEDAHLKHLGEHVIDARAVGTAEDAKFL